MARHFWKFGVLLLLAIGCGDHEKRRLQEGGGASTVERNLTLTLDGRQVTLPLDALQIYVVAIDSNDAETFELKGPGVMLAGTLPKKLRVGFDAKYENLFGSPVLISPRGGNAAEPKNSVLKIPNVGNYNVTGGTITLERTFGVYADDKGAAGSVKLELMTPDGAKKADGAFTVKISTAG